MRSDFIGLAGWKKNSFIDFPGTVSTVLFFSGCNLRCPYCHNCSLLTDPQDLQGLSSQVWEFLEKRKKVVEGVVFSGGEPTLHDNVPELMRQIRALGYKILLDTNGLLPQMIKQCDPDYLALDIKTAPALYPSLLDAHYDDVEQRLHDSLTIVKNMGENAEVRITVAPNILTTEVVMRLMDFLEGVKKIYLQPMSLKNPVLTPEFFKDLRPYTTEEIKKFQKMLSKVVETCTIRSVD